MTAGLASHEAERKSGRDSKPGFWAPGKGEVDSGCFNFKHFWGYRNLKFTNFHCFLIWTGNSRWVHAMEWSGQKEFVAASTIPFSVNGVEAGLQKAHGPLTFLKVHNSGHMVPMDQPKASLEMLRRWMHNRLTDDHLVPM